MCLLLLMYFIQIYMMQFLKCCDLYKWQGTFFDEFTSFDQTIISDIPCKLHSVKLRYSTDSAFQRLIHRLWSDHEMRLSTKIGVYSTVVLTSLLYFSESQTWYRQHLKQFEQFQLRCLRKISLKEKIQTPNTAVLERCGIQVSTPHQISIPLGRTSYSNGGRWGWVGKIGGQHKRYMNVLEYNRLLQWQAPEPWNGHVHYIAF